MCGIAGVVKFGRDERVQGDTIRQMCAVMSHRGPDDDGFYVSGPVGLGMRRLSIVDLARGHQPISNEDETAWIVFNGEIYNHAELREQLQARGHRYRTNSDTETIVHLYEEYGRDCVRHLRGMFAFAIWDVKKQRIFIARDRLGIKPIYYRLTSGSLVFGSEIKVVLAEGSQPQFNRQVLPEYLAFGYVSGSESFYDGIVKLMPGHTMEAGLDGRVNIESYWDLPVTDEDSSRGEAYYIEKYRDLLEQAVKSHLMSDVPLGVFLSGGIDSSAVAALMAKLRHAPVETFSVGYAEDTYSELPYARMVAKHLKSVHHEVLVSREQFFDSLPRLIWHEDEPIAWPSSVPLYFVARLARERVKVVLTGEGSDETLGGYARYSFTLKNAALDRYYRGLVPGAVRHLIRNTIEDSSWLSATLRRKLAHTPLARDGNSWASMYFDNFLCAFSERQQHSLLSEEIAEFKAGAPYQSSLEYWDRSSGDMLHRLLYTDIKTYLVELLMKQDNMSMAASIESRVPFLDHVLVEFATNIPRKFQLQGLSGKRILKKAVQDLLPHEILYRKKLGFPTPWSRWLKGRQLQEIRDLLLEPRSVDRKLFQRAAIERLFDEHKAGHIDHDDRIWRLLNLELWHRVCIEGEGRAMSSSAVETEESVAKK